MSNKQNIQTKQQIFHQFIELVELFPQYSITQHMIHVLRPQTGCYTWTDAELLKKFEKYRDELERELADIVGTSVLEED
jgi:hypothetical protein